MIVVRWPRASHQILQLPKNAVLVVTGQAAMVGCADCITGLHRRSPGASLPAAEHSLRGRSSMLSAVILLLFGPAIGVIVGWLLGGRLANLVTLRLRALWLLWLAAGVQAAQYYVRPLRTAVENRLD